MIRVKVIMNPLQKKGSYWIEIGNGVKDQKVKLDRNFIRKHSDHWTGPLALTMFVSTRSEAECLGEMLGSWQPTCFTWDQHYSQYSYLGTNKLILPSFHGYYISFEVKKTTLRYSNLMFTVINLLTTGNLVKPFEPIYIYKTL